MFFGGFELDGGQWYNKSMKSLSGELRYERMDEATLKLALEMRKEGWPNECIKEDYYYFKVKDFDEANQAWLVYCGDDLIGLTGIYTFDEDEKGWDDLESIWMDWFMVKKEFRRRGFGRQILLDTIEYCRNLKRFKYFRLDTTFWQGRPALKLYDEVMKFCEKYTIETPDAAKGDYYLIYSYALHGDEIKKWNNQPLELDGAE